MDSVETTRNEDALVDVIRKWYPTICYELILPLLPIRISHSQPATPYGDGFVYGAFHGEDQSITMYVLPPNAPVKLRGNYLITLAHEVRHAWQHRYKVPPTEGDANDCRSCRKPIREGIHCAVCQQTEIENRIVAEAVAAKAEADRRIRMRRDFANRLSLVFNWPQKIVSENRARRNAARREAAFAYKMQHIDAHPQNGKFGWWAIDGTYYVQAISAAEAVMRVADDLSSETPEIEFFGDKTPFILK